MWTTTRDYSPRGRARLEAFLDWTYQSFIEGVARGRGLSEEDVLAAAEGRVWTGAQAQERGLVDELGGFADALAVTRQEIGLEPDAAIELRRFPPPRTLWEQALDLALLGQTRFLGVETWLERLSPGVLSTPPIAVR
jgi:protease-4